MKTVKVRIAVAVDKNGSWSASGWGGVGNTQKDDLLMGYAIETLENGEKQFWLEAELPIPEEIVVVPEVTVV